MHTLHITQGFIWEHVCRREMLAEYRVQRYRVHPMDSVFSTAGVPYRWGVVQICHIRHTSLCFTHIHLEYLFNLLCSINTYQFLFFILYFYQCMLSIPCKNFIILLTGKPRISSTSQPGICKGLSGNM